jgi:hypothetical protein
VGGGDVYVTMFLRMMYGSWDGLGLEYYDWDCIGLYCIALLYR